MVTVTLWQTCKNSDAFYTRKFEHFKQFQTHFTSIDGIECISAHLVRFLSQNLYKAHGTLNVEC